MSDFYTAVSNAGFNIGKGRGTRLGVGIVGRPLHRKPRMLPGVNFADEKSIHQFLLRAFPRLKTDPKSQRQAVIWRETIRYYFQFGWSEKETAAQLRDYFYLASPDRRESVPYKKLVGGKIEISFIPARIGGRHTMRKTRKRVGGRVVVVTSSVVRTPVKDIAKKIRRLARGLRQDGKARTPQVIERKNVAGICPQGLHIVRGDCFPQTDSPPSSKTLWRPVKPQT
jgi:hypothetical protein